MPMYVLVMLCYDCISVCILLKCQRQVVQYILYACMHTLCTVYCVLCVLLGGAGGSIG